jgi:hypothetical protein
LSRIRDSDAILTVSKLRHLLLKWIIGDRNNGHGGAISGLSFLPLISLADWLGSGTIRPTSTLDGKTLLVNALRALGVQRR